MQKLITALDVVKSITLANSDHPHSIPGYAEQDMLDNAVNYMIEELRELLANNERYNMSYPTAHFFTIEDVVNAINQAPADAEDCYTDTKDKIAGIYAYNMSKELNGGLTVSPSVASKIETHLKHLQLSGAKFNFEKALEIAICRPLFD